MWLLNSSVAEDASWDITELTEYYFLRAFNGNEAESAQAEQGKQPTVTWAEGVIGNGSSDKVLVFSLVMLLPLKLTA